MKIQKRADKASNAIQDLIRQEYSLEDILDALEVLRDELDMDIESIEADIEREAMRDREEA